ncbi:MAG: glycerate kinase [Actinobacteria bacterium]|nr:glycerate kinase [Actinomycetota bacterium]
MKILVSTDKYKGSLSALEVCTIIGNAIRKVDRSIEVVISPMADGGEGTVDTLVESEKGRYVKIRVKDPLGKVINSRFGIIKKDIAVIEMALASGLWLVPDDKRNPMETTTYGTGELIRKALDMGCRKVIIGIGGSATTDGGMGMAQALGVRFYDESGNLLGFGGKQLLKLHKIDISGIHPRVHSTEFLVACDVDNPLTGRKGAAYVYSPQKGATPEMVKELDRGLLNFAKIIKKDLGKDVKNLKGAGAAGGLGAGLVAFLGAKLMRGTDIIIETTSLRQKMLGADLVITGEGAFDRQTFFGKSAYGVARLAREYNIPVITINGSVLTERRDISSENLSLFSGNFSIINRPMSLEEAIKDSRKLLENTTREIITFYLTVAKAASKRLTS